MKRATPILRINVVCLSLLLLALPQSRVLFAETLAPEEIAKRAFVVSKVADSNSDATFTLSNANGQQRIRKTQGKTKLVKGTLNNRRVVRFISPADVKGTTTLLVENDKADDDIWIYLPALKKTRRLVSNNKRDAFVGTDFSYGDVIGHKVEDWQHKLVREEKIDGRDCYVLESTPKTSKVGENSGYSKRVGWIDKINFIALQGEAYDLSGKLLKRFHSRDVQEVDAKLGRFQPMLLEADNVQSGHKTTLQFENFKANVGVGDEYFTVQYLEKP